MVDRQRDGGCVRRVSQSDSAPRPFTLLRGAEEAWGRTVWRQIDRARARWVEAEAKSHRVPWSSWCHVPRELVTHALLGDELGPDSSPRSRMSRVISTLL